MLHTVYKTINLVNGSFYIGYHKTDDAHDCYIGSGKRILRAVAKYGAGNFKKEILAVFRNKDEAFALEEKLVAEQKQNPLCYNIKNGGEGGFDFINDNCLIPRESRSRGGKAMRKKVLSDPKLFERFLLSLKTGRKTENWKLWHSAGTKAWTGNKHSPESRLLMRSKKMGKLNNQFGTVWITNGIEEKKVKLEMLSECELAGWKRGRVRSTVGRLPLEQHIGVRLPDPLPNLR